MTRRLGQDEGPLWQALLLESVENHPECFVTSIDKMRAISDAWFAEQITKQVVVTAGEDDAFGVLQETEDGVRLHSMYVKPAARGRGLAQSIIAFLCDEAARRGYDRIELGVLEDNSAAVSLYEKSGFAMAYKEPFGDRVDCKMVKSLPAAV